MTTNDKTRILFFIGSLRSGGKERRLLELMTYLKQQDTYEMMLVVTKDIVHYPNFYKLDIPYHILRKEKYKVYTDVLHGFYQVCRQFQPHVIHTWGRVQTFYTLPTVIAQGIPLINSQITDARPRRSTWSVHDLIDKLNFRYSSIILSNSKAGLAAFNPPATKSKVIYNGINMSRFENLPAIEAVKEKYKIMTPYTVVMSASFSPNKDYELFWKVARQLTNLRKDVTCIGVGASHDDARFQSFLDRSSQHPRILFPGRINDVEALVQASTIGVLFSNQSVHGEGISNSIMEYMALAKPVVANDAGGTKEIVVHNKNGYLVQNHTVGEIVGFILELLDNTEKYQAFSAACRETIAASFSLDRMGKEFEQVYEAALEGTKYNRRQSASPVKVLELS